MRRVRNDILSSRDLPLMCSAGSAGEEVSGALSSAVIELLESNASDFPSHGVKRTPSKRASPISGVPSHK